MLDKRKTKQIYVGDVAVGGDAPVSIQSMTNTRTSDIEATVRQIKSLESLSCEIIRVAVPDNDSAVALGKIRSSVKIPVIADIHFDYRLALKAIQYGADAVRINPGNIGNNEKVASIIRAAKDSGIPIRIGVNAGSLEKDLLEKYGVTDRALVESALRHVDFFEKNDFYDIKVSVKASSIPLTIDAYKLLSEKVDYPLHIGITEAGTLFKGMIKSSVGIGALLSEGIGDTLRVSLTGNPEDEVKVGWEIVKSLNLRQRGPEFISCPTCGRTEIELADLAAMVEKSLEKLKEPLSIAVMGCPVNGPGEAKNCDYGIAGGRGQGIIFKKGVVVEKVPEKELLDKFVNLLRKDGYNVS